MTYLNKKTVYLAGSIHHNNDCGVSWREEITPKLKQFGLEVIDPCKQTLNGLGEVGQDKEFFKNMILEKDFKKVKDAFFPILKKDLRCVDISHFIIVNYTPSIRHIGTIHELVLANIEKKPILLYYPPEEIADFNPWMACLVKEQHIFDNWDTMLEYIKQVDLGNFDTSLWY
jgi:hypothetical protein